MARKHQPEAPAAPVRWTDEEWHAIAHRILTSAGIDDPAALDVGEIKAKDVFHAQEVLPEDRRRKLISIQQGFDGSRKRLQAHFDSLPSAASSAAAQAGKDLEQPAAGAPAKAAAKAGAAKDKPEAEAAGADNEAAPAPGTAPQHASERMTREAQPQHAAAPNEAQAAVAAPAEPQTAPLPKPQDRPAQATAGNPAGPVEHAMSPAHVGAPGMKAERKKSEASPMAAESALLRPDFIELARPFVAMVCEEFASALVKALGNSIGADALKAAVNPAGTPPAGRKQADARQRDATRSERGGAAPAPAPAANAPESGAGSNELDLDDDHEQAENDVQPLFDPKLPPDPNSPFRPRIALVAARPQDLLDLQQRFPHFELIAVTLDELRSNPVLRTCQRIVGLREDVPAPADEYLRRSFGSRYFRANGGVTKVREQLQSWLNNPAVASADPFRPPKQGNGKGAGGPRKRQFRRPRP